MRNGGCRDLGAAEFSVASVRESAAEKEALPEGDQSSEDVVYVDSGRRAPSDVKRRRLHHDNMVARSRNLSISGAAGVSHRLRIDVVWGGRSGQPFLDQFTDPDQLALALLIAERGEVALVAMAWSEQVEVLAVLPVGHGGFEAGDFRAFERDVVGDERLAHRRG